MDVGGWTEGARWTKVKWMIVHWTDVEQIDVEQTYVKWTYVEHSVANCPKTLQRWHAEFFFLFLLNITIGCCNFKSLQSFLHRLLCFYERKKKRKKKKLHLLQDTSLPHLVLLFPAPSILTLLVSIGVIAQTPFNSSNINNNNNTNNKRNPIT